MSKANREKILKLIVEFLEKRGQLPKKRKELLNYSYLENGHIDSFGMVQLLMTLEDEFEVDLQQKNWRDMGFAKTVGGLVDLVDLRIKEKA